MPALLFAALTVLSSLQVRAQPALSAPRSGPDNAAIEAARSAFEAQPDPDRKAIQDALVWFGAYNGVADGTFGRQTYSAIGLYQAQAGLPVNGILDPPARAALLRAAEQSRRTAGFTLLDVPKTGIRVGIPTRILPKQDTNTSGGRRWQSSDDKITVDTRLAPPDATLQALFERNIAIQTHGRVVTYKVLRPDFFVIAGETSAGKFYVRYDSGPGGLRGLSIGYDKGLAPQFDRLVVAIANSFRPIPIEVASPVVAQSSNSAPQQTHVKSQTQKLIGTGLATGIRQVVTTAPVTSCREVVVSGLKPIQITGSSTFVLTFADDLKARPVKVISEALTESISVLIVGFIEEDGNPDLFTLSANAMSPGALSGPVQPGMSGAAVLNMSGAVLGLVGGVSSERQTIAGILPSASYPIVPVSNSGLQDYQREPTVQGRSAAEIVGSVRSALVPITCDL